MCSVVIISFFNGNNLNNHKQVKKKKIEKDNKTHNVLCH